MKPVVFRFHLIMALSMLSDYSISQSISWTGEIDNDFYNELNWVISGTTNHPAEGTLVEGVAIDVAMTIVEAHLDVSGSSLSFTQNTLGINLSGASLTADAISNGQLELSAHSTVTLTSAEPIGDNLIVDLNDATAWVKLTLVNPDMATNLVHQIVNNDQALVLDESLRINQYYFLGSLIRLLDPAYAAMTLFDNVEQTGDSFEVSEFIIHSDEQLGDFDNRASSFRLERGYTAVVAIFQNGIGKSQAYIASEEPLEVDLPMALDNNVSFVRVMPWNWVTKKGASGFKQGVGASWTYNWGRGAVSLPNYEYAPMSWGTARATTASELVAKQKITHVLGFNESDNCNGQSGQYGNLCQIDVAVPSYRYLMRTGLRLVSPSPREGAPIRGGNQWLVDFRDEAIDQDVRYDVLGIHWYDWGGNPKNTPFEEADEVFRRFKNHLRRVYEEHGLPIWLTEFNANANRDASVHIDFLKLALPYLDSLPYIERYDYFEPNPSVAGNREDITFMKFFDENGDITELGTFYRDHSSVPSIPEPTWIGPTILEEMDQNIGVRLEVTKDTLNEGEQLLIKAIADRSVGSPQSITIQVDNLTKDRFVLGDTELTIEEGFKESETTLTLTDNDVVEDTVMATISISTTSAGLDWNEEAIGVTVISEDEVPLGLRTGQLGIFPNPVLQTFQIKNPMMTNGELEIFSLNGRRFLLEPAKDDVHDISHLNSGIYVLRITAGGSVIQTMKLIKQ